MTRRLEQCGIAFALIVTIVAPLDAFAHTKEDEAACRPDVFRLCKTAIPSTSRIVACLERNKRQLSPACHRVFDREPNGQAAAPTRSEAQPVQWGR